MLSFCIAASSVQPSATSVASLVAAIKRQNDERSDRERNVDLEARDEVLDGFHSSSTDNGLRRGKQTAKVSGSTF